MTGKRFGKWTVERKAGNTPRGAALWHCACECGSAASVPGGDLRSGKSLSCGCAGSRANIGALNRTHGQTNTALYTCWKNMRSRCDPETGRDNYAGRGIRVCQEWEEFATFLKWAESAGYREGLTIERKDVSGNYEPGNCTWIPREAQAKNKTNNLRREDGRLWVDIAAENGITAASFRCRVCAGGWPVEVAASWPMGKRRTQRTRNEKGQWQNQPRTWRR